MTVAGSKFDSLDWKIKNPEEWRNRTGNEFDVNSMAHHDAAGAYLKRYPDVAKDGYFSTRPYEHYLKYGKSEGRIWAGSTSSDERSNTMTISSLPAPPEPTTRNNIPEAPKLELPELKLSEDTSLVNQINKLSSEDSLIRQQARVGAHERGVASGTIHSSQQEGAAERAVLDKITPLATAEANKAISEEMSNWQQESNRRLEEYRQKYSERAAMLGYDAEMQRTMANNNTQLAAALMGDITSLMNNPEIDFGPEVKNKLTSIYNGALDNNNLILGMGFRY